MLNNPMRNAQQKVLSVDVVVEDGKSYQVITREAQVGQSAEQKVLVDKNFYQVQIDKLQAQIDKLVELRDKCAEQFVILQGGGKFPPSYQSYKAELLVTLLDMANITPDTLAKDIEYIKQDIKIINDKLDQKYVSHETFDLTVNSLNTAIGWIVKIAIFVITPIYGAVVALLFKVFTQQYGIQNPYH